MPIDENVAGEIVEPVGDAPTELTLTEKVAADEAGDAEIAALKTEIATLEANLAAQQSLVAELAKRIVVLENSVDVMCGASPSGGDSKLAALVAKMHEKMKLLIPMEG